MNAIPRVAFAAAFALALQAIAAAEKVTKAQLSELSRSLLAQLHDKQDSVDGTYGDIQFINQLLHVLTPINRKVAVEFFGHFSGFHYDAKTKESPAATQEFTKKSAKRGVAAQKDAIEFLADPHNNIWTWAERNIEVNKTEFTADKVTKFIEGALKKLNNDKQAVLEAVLKGGITLDDLIAVMQNMEGVELNVEE